MSDHTITRLTRIIAILSPSIFILGIVIWMVNGAPLT